MATIGNLAVTITGDSTGITTAVKQSTKAIDKLGKEAKESGEALNKSIAKNADRAAGRLAAMQSAMSGFNAGPIINAGVAFAGLGTAATLAVNVAVGAIRNLASALEDAFNDIDKLAKTAIRFNVSTAELQVFDLTLQQAGISMEQGMSAVRRLSTLVGDAARGNAAAQKTFEDLGLSVEELSSQNQVQQFNSYLDALRGVENLAVRASLATQGLGRSSLQFTTLINDQGVTAARTRRLLSATSATMSEELAANTQEAVDALTLFRQVFTNVSQNIAANLAPVFTAFGNAMQFIQERAAPLFEALYEMAAALGEFVIAIGRAIFQGDSFDGTLNALLFVVRAITGMLTIMTRVVENLGRAFAPVAFLFRGVLGISATAFNAATGGGIGDRQDSETAGMLERTAIAAERSADAARAAAERQEAATAGTRAAAQAGGRPFADIGSRTLTRLADLIEREALAAPNAPSREVFMDARRLQTFGDRLLLESNALTGQQQNILRFANALAAATVPGFAAMNRLQQIAASMAVLDPARAFGPGADQLPEIFRDLGQAALQLSLVEQQRLRTARALALAEQRDLNARVMARGRAGLRGDDAFFDLFRELRAASVFIGPGNRAERVEGAARELFEQFSGIQEPEAMRLALVTLASATNEFGERVFNDQQIGRFAAEITAGIPDPATFGAVLAGSVEDFSIRNAFRRQEQLGPADPLEIIRRLNEEQLRIQRRQERQGEAVVQQLRNLGAI